MKPAKMLILAVAELAILGGLQAFPEVGNTDFNLSKWGSDERVDLASFKGQIVVLDFFAPWCAPCLKASPQIESGIQNYYAARKGNRYAIPVSVVAINVDDSKPEETAGFIEKSGLEYILTDSGGFVLTQYGGVALPFIVIIDATCMTADSPPKIVYSMAGFEGVGGLRKIIDGIGGSSQAEESSPDNITSSAVDSSSLASLTADPGYSSAEMRCTTAHSLSAAGKDEPVAAANRSQDFAVDSAFLNTKDIFLADTIIEYNLKDPLYKLTTSITHGYIGMHYRPFDAIQQENELENHRVGIFVDGRYRLADSLEWSLGGGAYDGFMDYRSLWLDEYYRQLFGKLSGYREATPNGYSVTTGPRWEYMPACGFLQGTLGYQSDIVSPAYERDISTFPPSLIRANDKYETISGGLSLENVMSRRVRALQELQIINTTDRELRFTLKSSLNLAMSESLVWRAELAGSEENPSFKSRSVGSVLEYDWNKTWFLSLTARYYEDTGQIELGLPGDSSAPAVRTYQTALGLRWQGTNKSMKFSIGPYTSKYLERPADKEFENLYQDRDWLYVHVACMCQF